MLQTRMTRLVLFVTGCLLAASFCGGETLYITVPQKEAVALKASDVTIKLDKKALPATEVFSVDTASRTPEILSHPAGRRNYVMVFDLINGKPESLVADRRVAVALIDKLGKDDLAAVAVFSRMYGLRLWSGLTNDRGKLYTALNAVGQDKVPGTILGPDGNLYSDTSAQTANSVELIPETQFLSNITTAQNPPEDKKKKQPAQDPGSMFIIALSDLSYALAGVGGPKIMVLFSPGFDAHDVKVKVDQKGFADSYVDSAIQEPEYLATPEEQRAEAESERRSENEKSFNATPVVQVEGVPEFVAGTFTSVAAVSPGGQEFDFFKKLTDITGGAYLRDAEAQPAATVDRILGLSQKYYVIGFEGKREKEYRDLHSLHVEANQKDLNSSSSYVPPRTFDQYTPVERRLHVSEAEYKNYLQPASGQRFWADFVYQQGPRVTLFSEVPGPSILKQDVDQYAMEAYGVLFDAAGNLVDFSMIPVRFDLKNKQLRERLNKAGVKVWSMVQGCKGPGTVRWIFVDSQFGDTVTHSEPIEIMDAQLTTTYPFVPSTNFDWIVWPKPQDAQTRRGVEMRYPYALGTDLFFPELGPQFKKTEGDKVVYFRIYNRLPESKNPPIHLFLVDSAGKQTEIQQFSLMQKPKDLEQNGMELFWKLQALPEVPAGSYRLQVSIHDVVGKRDVIREMPVEIK